MLSPFAWTSALSTLDPCGGAGLAVADEHVPLGVGVGRHQVVGDGVEGHVAAVGAHRREVAGAIGLRLVVAHAHSLGGTRRAIAHEHVRHAVGVAGDQVGRPGGEAHHRAVGVQAHARALAVGLRPTGGHAHPRGRPRWPARARTRPTWPLVSPETRLVARDKKATHRAVGADHGRPAVAVGLRTAAGHAHSADGVGLPVVDEDVVATVGVARDQVAGSGDERHVAAVGAYGRPAALVVALRPAGATRSRAPLPRPAPPAPRARQPDTAKTAISALPSTAIVEVVLDQVTPDSSPVPPYYLRRATRGPWCPKRRGGASRRPRSAASRSAGAPRAPLSPECPAHRRHPRLSVPPRHRCA